MSWHKIKGFWQPKPVDPPKVDPEFKDMGDLERAAESWRYNILSWEFWVSPKGGLREFVRHNTKTAVALAIPALLVFPLVGMILGQLVAWLGMLISLAGHLILLPVVGLIALVLVTFTWELIKSLLRRG